MAKRNFFRGPRFALRSTDPDKVKACLKCVYGNGEHASWCEKLWTPQVGETVLTPSGYGEIRRIWDGSYFVHISNGEILFSRDSIHRAEPPARSETPALKVGDACEILTGLNRWVAGTVVSAAPRHAEYGGDFVYQAITDDGMIWGALLLERGSIRRRAETPVRHETHEPSTEKTG